MNQTVSPVDGLMVRASMYTLLAVGFSYPNAEQRERFLTLAQRLKPWIEPLSADWPDRLNSLQEAFDEAALQAVEADFYRLFSGSMEAVPFEAAYEPDIFRKQHTLADIAGFYRAFGFNVPNGSRWQPDHVGVELEFCSIVLQRTAQAMEKEWPEQVAVCVDTLRKFLLDHLGRWSDAFAHDLTKVAQQPYYQELATLTQEWLSLELTALDLEPDFLRSRQVYADDAAVPNCGGCTGCGPSGPVSPTGPCSQT